MTMNDVDKIYKKILLENGVNENELLSSYKKRLKKLLQENLPDLVVVKSTQRNQPEQFMTRETKQEAVATFNSATINENEGKETISCFSGNKEGAHYLPFTKIGWLFE